MDFALAGVAMALTAANGELRSLHVALTGTNPLPLLLHDTAPLLGRPVDESLLAALDKLVKRHVSPARTTATPSNHRRRVSVALARRLLTDLLAEDRVAPAPAMPP